MKDLQYYKDKPKTDAHNHLNLGMSYTTYIKWAGFTIPDFPRPLKGLDEMHELISTYTRPRTQTSEDVANLLEMSVLSAIEDGISCLEGSVDISFLAHFNGNIDNFLKMVSDLVERYKHKIKIIPELGMGKTFDKEKIALWAPELISSGVFKSIDLYGPEIEDEIDQFKHYFDLASKLGLKKRAHVGEFSDAQSVVKFVNFFELDEVQHGIGAAKDDLALQFLADNKVRCNVCPTSNVLLGAVPSLKEHPIKKMLDAGVPIALGTDDLIFFEDSISVQLFKLVHEHVITEDDAEKILTYK